MNARDELLTALLEHDASTWIPEIHLDDCEDDSCTGCDPQHFVEKAVAQVEWHPNGGHDSGCAYVGGISPKCTCGGESRG